MASISYWSPAEPLPELARVLEGKCGLQARGLPQGLAQPDAPAVLWVELQAVGMELIFWLLVGKLYTLPQASAEMKVALAERVQGTAGSNNLCDSSHAVDASLVR